MITITAPVMGAAEVQAAADQVESGWLTPGTKVRQFEQEWAEYVGTEYAVACSSGTLALILALRGLRSNKPWVVVPSFTCAPTVAAVVQAGFKPLFVGAEKGTLGMDPAQVANACRGRDVAAIMPVHVYGAPVASRVFKVAELVDVPVIEDACEAHGASYDDKQVGSLGLAGCFSFRGDKMITTAGVGGAVTTNDRAVYEEAMAARDLYLGSGFDRYVSARDAGWGAQMSEVQAAVGLAQLSRLDEFIEARRQQAGIYDEAFDQNTWVPGHVYWRYVVEVSSPKDTWQKLMEEGVESIPAFTPLHQQPIARYGHVAEFGYFGVDSWWGKHGLTVPIGPHLSDADVMEVVEKVSRFR